MYTFTIIVDIMLIYELQLISLDALEFIVGTENYSFAVISYVIRIIEISILSLILKINNFISGLVM